MDADDIVQRQLLIDTARPGSLDAARLEAALDAASDALFDVDLAAGTIRWSRGITLLLGHDPERIGQRVTDWRMLIHPDDAQAVMESGRAVLPSGASVWSHEFRLARADGSYAPVRVRAYVVVDGGTPSHVVGAVTDLGELRERERELQAVSEDLAEHMARERHERARAELLMRAATSDVLGEWDVESGACTWSPNVETVLGWPAHELRDTDAVLRHTDPEDGPRALADLQRRIAEGAGEWSGRVRFNAPNEEILLEAHGYVLRDETSRPLKVVGSIVRVREQRTVTRRAGAPVLTERHRQVLELVRLGRTNKEIAGELGISDQAAKVQVSKLLRKFGAPNRAALVASADDLGEVS